MSAIHAILILLIRLWAVTAILNSMSGAVQFLYLLIPIADNGGPFSANLYIYPFIWAIAGIAAWIAAPKIAKKLYPSSGSENISFAFDSEMLVTIGSFLMGAFILVEHAPQLLIKITTYFVEGLWPGQETPIAILKFLFRQVATEALIVVFALWLVLRPAQLSAIFSKLRKAGITSQQESEPKGEGQ